jgi:hypothetical protein
VADKSCIFESKYLHENPNQHSVLQDLAQDSFLFNLKVADYLALQKSHFLSYIFELERPQPKMCYRIKAVCGNPNYKPLGADPNDETAVHDPPYFCKLICQAGNCDQAIKIHVWAPVCGPLCFDCMYGGYRSYYAEQVALAGASEESKVYLATLPGPPVVGENSEWISDGEFGRLYSIWDRLYQLFIAQQLEEHTEQLAQQNRGAVKISSSKDQVVIFECLSQDELKKEIHKAYNQPNEGQVSVLKEYFRENMRLFLSHKEDLDAAHQHIANNKSFDDVLKGVLAGGSKVQEVCPSFLARKV